MFMQTNQVEELSKSSPEVQVSGTTLLQDLQDRGPNISDSLLSMDIFS